MPDRSRLITVASDAIAKNTTAVPPKAVMTSVGPFLKPSTIASRRDSIRPMKNVKPAARYTPAGEFLVFSIANMKPNAPPRKTIRLMPGAHAVRDAGAHADPGAEHRGQQRQREQPVGVAQDAVAVDGQRAGAGVAGLGLQALVHGSSVGG